MSLRSRLLAGMAIVAIVLIGAAVLITSTTRSALMDRVDAQLTSAKVPLRGGFGGGGPGGGQPFNIFYVGAVDAKGGVHTVLSPTSGAAGRPLPKIDAKTALAAVSGDQARPFTVGSVSGSGRWRVIAGSEGPGSGNFLIALSLHDVTTSLARIERVEIAVTASILAILALVTFFVLRLGLRPIKQMTATATAIAAGDLSHRVPEVTTGTEAGELGAALNTMMTTIEDAFDRRTESEARLRQFVADASHELRTPVTTIRGYAELYRSGGLDDPDELSQAMRRTEQESIRMGSLVEDLLLLARLDQDPTLQRPGAVDLGVIAVDAVSDARAVDPERPVTASVAEGVTVDGDEGRLRQVVANLVGNALVHTPPGTPVQVRVDRDGSDAVLEVCDEGPGMSERVAARAFERFFRADPARSRHAGGSGLGLSIVKAIVNAHGGTVTIVSPSDKATSRGTTVRMTLPVIGLSGKRPADHSVPSGS